ncbi:MAG: response regulator [Anaerolineae bacterium]|nr:response regulator [Anaerolineae bacterium]
MSATVLIIDDDPVFVEMLSFVLDHGGFRAMAAYNGAEGIKMLTSEPVDIVILDVMLPDMDGFETCRRIRNTPSVSDVPILMLSARTQVVDKLSGFESGADDYVAKPADPKEVMARLKALLARARRAPPPTSRILTFVGAKGGVGTTTTALNVATALCNGEHKVLYLELQGYGASAPWLLSLEPSPSLQELMAPEGFRLTMTSLQNCIVETDTGLHYLPGYPNGVAFDAMRPGSLGDALTLLQQGYDIIVVDVGIASLSHVSEVLGQSTAVLPVAEHDSLAEWHLRTLLAWLGGSTHRARVPGIVLVQRYAGASQKAATQIASDVGKGILQVVPSAAALLYHTHSRQELIVTADPEAEVSQSYFALAERLLADPIEAPPSLRP